MNGLRRSLSVHRGKRDKKDDSKRPTISAPRAYVERRASVDTFVIRGRTRFPSHKTPVTEPLDLHIAKRLLSYDDVHSRSAPLSRSTSQHLVSKPISKMNGLSRTVTDSRLPRYPPSADQDGPRKYSDPALSFRTGFSIQGSSYESCASSERDNTRHIQQYNLLAKEFELKLIESESRASHRSEEAATITASGGAKRWTKRRLNRSGSSGTKEEVFNRRLTHKTSVSSLFNRKSRNSSKQKSLEDICRLGGISVLHLPFSYAAVSLILPTCLAATANYLMKQGRGIPGIFRIPGQASVVNRLYDHYLSQLGDAEIARGQIQTTIGAIDLPSTIGFGIHDVASAFKKLLWEIPGGIIGSVSLFKVLHEIQSKDLLRIRHQGNGKDGLKAHLIALAILSVQSNRRVALISALFGLLALLKQDDDGDTAEAIPFTAPRLLSPESMSSKALGLVFAPLLVGNLTDEIELNSSGDTASLLSHSSRSKRAWIDHFKTPKPTKNAKRKSQITRSMEKNNAAAAIIEMILRNWIAISRRMRTLQIPANSKPTVTSTEYFENLPLLSPLSETGNTFRGSVDSALQEQRMRSTRDLIKDPYLNLASRSPSKDSILVSTNSSSGHRAVNQSGSLCFFSENTESNGAKAPFPRLRSGDARQQSENVNAVADPGNCHVELSTSQIADGEDLIPDEESVWWENSYTHNKRRVNTADQSAKPATITKVLSKSSSSSKTSITAATQGFVENAVTNQLPNSFFDDDSTDDQTHSGKPRYKRTSASYNASIPEPASSEDNSDVVSNPFDSRNASTILSTSSALSRSFTEESSTQYRTSSRKPSRQGSLMTLGSDLDEQKTVRKAQLGPETAALASTPKLSPSRLPRRVLESKFDTFPKFSPPLVTKRGSVANIVAPLRGSTPNSKHSSSKLEAEKEKTTAHMTERLYKSISSNQSSKYSNTMPFHHKKTAALTCQVRQLAPASEPPIARHINFKSSQESEFSSDKKSESLGDPFITQPTPKPNVGTLYAEVARLREELNCRSEEVSQLKQQLDAMRRFRDSGTLSEQLRFVERESKLWRHRAEWAERCLFRKIARADADTSS